MTSEPLRILQVAPCWFAVPPEGHGGIERVVHQLTEELVARGHEVVVDGGTGVLVEQGDIDAAARVRGRGCLAAADDPGTVVQFAAGPRRVGVTGPGVVPAARARHDDG